MKRKLHGGKTFEHDWSKTVKQFNLHHHLTTPTSRDLRNGVENSHRLARNHIKLGIDDEIHRKV